MRSPSPMRLRMRAHAIEPADVLDRRLAADREKPHVGPLVQKEPGHVEEVLDALLGPEDADEPDDGAAAREELAPDVRGVFERLEVDEVVDHAHAFGGTMGAKCAESTPRSCRRRWWP